MPVAACVIPPLVAGSGFSSPVLDVLMVSTRLGRIRLRSVPLGLEPTQLLLVLVHQIRMLVDRGLAMEGSIMIDESIGIPIVFSFILISTFVLEHSLPLIFDCRYCVTNGAELRLCTVVYEFLGNTIHPKLRQLS